MAVMNRMRLRGPRKDITGQRFGKLVVVSWAHHSRWLCRCDCGGTSVVLTANLKRGNTTSCGCIRRILSSKRATKHGLYHTPAYKTWLSVRRRCYDTNCRGYQDYGAKGIDMFDEWAADPAAFIRDVGQPPTKGHTLDRIENAKGYYPGNVRWATPLEQANNKTNNRWVTYQGRRYTLSQLARKIAAECGVAHSQMLTALEHEIYGRGRNGQ